MPQLSGNEPILGLNILSRKSLKNIIRIPLKNLTEAKYV
jgi:hypothetical protein